MAYSVLVVEDNQDMRQSIVSFLSSEGMKVRAVASAEEAIDEVDENSFDTAVIDINLPGKSGFELIEYIREQGYDFPLIAMTARDGLEDKLKGFNLGLTDYVVKPFNIKELHARLIAHLKSSSDEDKETRVGDFYIDPSSLVFKYKNKKIELTQLEFRMMQALIKKSNTLLKLDDLIEEVWGESDEMVNPPIRIHIGNLRKKIGDDNFTIIKTIPGSGYILNAKDSSDEE